jgi:3',5'-cyclic-AMP phosphodiesterase
MQEVSSTHIGPKILVMTDIHIRSENQKIMDPLEKFELALVHALKAHPDAFALILTGDLTHSGKVEEYTRLNNALQLARNARVPYYLMLGNHDNRDNFLRVFPETNLTEDGHVQQVINLPLNTHRCILLDTLDGPPFSRETNHGFLCEKRLEWLEKQLIQAQEDDIGLIVMLHHPAFPVLLPGMDSIRLKNDEEFMNLLLKYPHDIVQQIVCGHIHRTISGTFRGKSYVIFKSPCHQCPLAMDSMDCSISTPEPGAYGIICFPDRYSIVNHTEDFELAVIGKDKDFSCKDALPEVY